ncbi:MAG: 2-C-methyl-D-erythritol 4-phosphate cytidylyltransferase [Trueperella sp.]|nr:2-C-methyl-D-erythritol 4-phosphate cytidylyltransferase [Trueperella sp.]
MIAERAADFTAVIAGAGSGTRLGADRPKALVLLAGEPLIVHAVRTMRAAGVANVVVTVPAAVQDEFSQALAAAELSAELVVGGSSRQESVANGLAAVTTEFVLVHDAARALTSVAIVRRVMAALLAGNRAVVPAVPVADTVKVVAGAETPSDQADQLPADQPPAEPTVVAVAKPEPELEQVLGTLNRSSLRAVQTPQGFSTELLRTAHAAGITRHLADSAPAPDDAALVEEIGEPVLLVPGGQEAMKITTAFDLAVAELMAGKLMAGELAK